MKQQGNGLAPLPCFSESSRHMQQTFWNDFVRRDLIFGERVDKLQMRVQIDRGFGG